MAWLEKGVSLTPNVYNVELHDYKHIPELTEKEIKKSSKEWLETLCEMWGEKEGWLLSGALALSFITDTFPRPNTNTDIIINLENCPDLLSWMEEKAKAQSLFLFSRAPRTFHPDSYRPLRRNKQWFPEMKLETYYLTNPEAISFNKEKNQNYMFCQVNPDGMIIPENKIDTRIRIYPYQYQEEHEAQRSTEDGRLTNPRYLKFQHKKNTPLIEQGNKRVLPVNLYHLKEIKEFIKSKNPKHAQDIERINTFLKANPHYNYR